MFVFAVFVPSKTGLAVGLMVTASHNAEPDNGIKMVDPNGGMLSQDWEGYAEVGAVTRRGNEEKQVVADRWSSLLEQENDKGVALYPSAPFSSSSLTTIP